MNMTDSFLTVNPYSRSGYNRPDTFAVVLHWIGNAGQSAMNARNYFESLRKGVMEDGKLRYASAQYIIDISGEVVRTMPDTEVAYHCGPAGKVDPASGKLYTDLTRKLIPAKYLADPYSASYACIGIEMCHKEWTGEFSKETLDSAVELVASLFGRYPRLTDPLTQIVTHEAIVGWKFCPQWFHSHPADLDLFRQRVAAKLA
jgi:N-acetylmuramoyl-L-alanine amidase